MLSQKEAGDHAPQQQHRLVALATVSSCVHSLRHAACQSKPPLCLDTAMPKVLRILQSSSMSCAGV